MTGGRSSIDSGRKWDEKDVQGMYPKFALSSSRPHGFNSFTGLQRVRDKLMADLQELNKSKPRGKEDDALVATITRLEPAYTVARDDLVCFFFHFPSHCERSNLGSDSDFRVHANFVSMASATRSSTSKQTSRRQNRNFEMYVHHQRLIPGPIINGLTNHFNHLLGSKEV